MTKTYLMITAAVVMMGFTACNNSNEAKNDADSLAQYVDSVESASPIYTEANWSAIDNGYQERATKAEKAMAAMDAEDKAKAEKSKEKYAALKAEYELKIKEKDAVVIAPDYRQVLRNRLFGEGKIGADMKFEFVTAENAHSVYKNFVDAVEANKENYTREDWDEIKVLYEALDTRKNAIEKDLPKGDNNKIAVLKVKFSTTIAIRRPLSKAAENHDAKQ